MTWLKVGIGAVVATSTASGLGARDTAIAQANEQSAQANAERERSNLQLTIRNAYKAAILNMQLGQAKMAMAKQGYDTDLTANVAEGMANANQAAVGAVGASAEAVLNDVRMRLGEEQARMRDNYENTLISYNAELEGIKVGTKYETFSPVRASYNGPSESTVGGIGLLNGLSTLMSRGMGGPSNGTPGAANTVGAGSGVSGSVWGNNSTPLGFSSGDLGGGLRIR